MFKKIQKYLLIHHPLLWNSKIVPITAILLVFNIAFYVLGFLNGGIDFTETEQNYRYNSEKGTILFFGALISILAFIVWLVFYLKNNAFKSFYPKTNFSLFKEWLLLLLASILLCGFPLSFMLGNDIRARSYFTKEEANKRCETLSLASLFVEGSYEVDEYEFIDSAGVEVERKIDHIVYQGKKYSLTSLLNKNIEGYSLFTHETDSLNEIRVKNWLFNNQKDSVKTVMNAFLVIAKEHQLKANINANEWLDLVYNYPDFEEVKIVGKNERDLYYYNEAIEDEIGHVSVPKTTIDSVNQYVKVIGTERYLFNKHYVPAAALFYSYDKISQSWTNPDVDIESLTVFFCVAMCLSIVIFSFRVSTGRNWLIALISVGVLNIIFGIATAIISVDYTYFIAVIITIVALLAYFIMILVRRKGKGISGITLNALLWMFPAFVPLICFLILELMKINSGYNEAQFLDRRVLYPTISWLEDNAFLVVYLDIVIVFFAMLFFSFKIKKWKGIAES